MSEVLSGVEAATGAAQFVGGLIGQRFGGPTGEAVVTYLLGQPLWAATAADLAAKLQDGTATGVEVAELFDATASTLAGFGVLAGLAGTVWLPITGAAGAALWMYKNLVPEDTKQAVWEDIFDPVVNNPLRQGLNLPYDYVIDPRCNNNYNLCRTPPPRRDPLTIDLDGDGIETIGIDPNNPILFDHDGDGIKTGTGWVNPDDALLVFDRNGNGTIDNGSELFGDATPLSAGGTAEDGFAALAQEDTNGDGLVNASDAHFAELRLWRDLNQDGISQSNELFTLESQGIAALKVAKTEHLATLANGNQIADLGGYIKTDGSEGSMGAVAGQMSDVNLASNPFYSEFTDNPTLSAEAAALPGMNGAGAVRDLQSASMLSPELMATLSGLGGYRTRDQLLAEVDTVIHQWADTSAMQTSDGMAQGFGYKVGYLMPGESYEWDEATYRWKIVQSNPAAAAALGVTAAEVSDMISVLERFNGQAFVNVESDGVRTATGAFASVVNPPSLVGAQDDGSNTAGLGSTDLFRNAFVQLSTEQVHLLKASYDALRQSVYDGLASQTRLTYYLDMVTLKIDESGIALDYSAMDAAIEARIANDATNGITDLVELVKTRGRGLDGWTGASQLARMLESTDTQTVTRSVLATLSLVHEGYWSGGDQDDFVVGGVSSDTLYARSGPDTIFGDAGNDTIFGGAGDDAIDGGIGDDNLRGDSGNDILTGGLGNDSLSGDEGDDTYVFRKGDGIDSITDSGANLGAKNVLVFSDYVQADLTLKRSGSELLFLFSNGDTVRLVNYFGRLSTNNDQILSEVRFADGTSAGVQTLIHQLGLYLSPAFSNTLTADNDLVFGSDSEDLIYALAGNDTIDGELGNDTIYGGSGNDTLIGGAGNDTLFGDADDDTYIFHRGDGVDSITDTGANLGAKNALVFSDYVVGDLTLGRSGDDLLFQFVNGDTVRLISYFDRLASEGDQILSEVRFADGTTVGVQTLIGQVGVQLNAAFSSTLTDYDDRVFGSDSNDLIYAQSGNDTIDGRLGNDTIYGGTGNDTMAGGVGTDHLLGEDGDDTYVFRRGDGVDTITDTGANLGAKNILLFSDYLRSEVSLSRSGGDLLFQFANGDTVKLTSYFDRLTKWDDQILSEVRFADGESVSVQGLVSQIEIHLNDYSNNATFTAYDDIVFAEGGNDVIYGQGGDDILNGGSGDDGLYGEAGNDTLLGGVGTDRLFGGAGDDTYVFRRGDGVDTITDTGANLGAKNALVFTDYVVADLTLAKSGGDLLFQFTNGDSVRLVNYFGRLSTDDDQILSEVRFADGASVGVQTLIGQVGVYLSAAFSSTLTNYDDRIYGSDSNDLIYAQEGNDTIDGGLGNDTLRGGAGNDSLMGGVGNDSLLGEDGDDSYVFRRGDGVDTITDTGANLGAKNALVFADYVVGDLNLGRSGDDLLFQFANGDSIRLVSYFGRLASYNDQILSEVRFADGASVGVQALIKQVGVHLGDYANNSTFTAYDDLVYGDGGNDVIYGGGGNDTIDGGTGADSMYGNAGDDTYVVDNVGDRAIESANMGRDLVLSSVAFTLGADVEDLTLTGTASINGTGNSANNVLIGNAGANTLTGLGGNDTLNGGSGNDILVGGTGNDTYLFDRGFNADLVIDTDTTAGNADKAIFGADIASDQLWFRHVGNDLEVSVIGTTDAVTIQNWYSGSGNRIEQFIAGDSRVLSDTQVETLVQAMAAFAPPSAGQTTLPSDYQTALAVVIGTNWQ